MTPNDRLVTELENCRDKLYREQPDTMGTVEAIINVLQYALCEHVWEVKVTPDSPDAPSERFTVCEKCGAEKLED